MTARPGTLPRPSGIWPILTLTALLACAVFAERVFLLVDVGDGQAAVVEILPGVIVVVALAFIARSRGRSLEVLRDRSFLVIWAPYLVLALALPVIGVVAGQVPVRGLAAARMPIVAVSALIVGAELRRRTSRPVATRLLACSAAIVCGYAVIQQLAAAKLLWSGLATSIHAWDVATQRAYGTSVVVGRASAFYTNPNILGAWSVTALLVGIFVARGWLRYAITTLALGSLILSQSRGATVGLLAAFVFGLALAWRRRTLPSLRALLPYVASLGAVLIGWYLLTLAGAPTASFFERFGRALGIVIGLDDPNMAGRVQFWESSMALYRSHPLGTFGPPEMLLGTAVDSEWVRTLLQGGPLLVATLGLALFGGAFALRGRGPDTWAVRSLSIFIAVAGIAEIPLQYPPAVIYWALIGAMLVAPRRAARKA